MTERWCYLFEKYSEGVLSDEEQREVCSLQEESEEFKLFWREAASQVSLMSTLQPVDDLKTFLSAALFIDEKVKLRKKKKSTFGFFLKVAALLLVAFLPAYTFWISQKLPEVAYSSSDLSKYDFLFMNIVELKEGAAVLKFKEGTVSFVAPVRLHMSLKGELELDSGAIYLSSNPGFNFHIKTPNREYIDVGTEFGVKVHGIESQLHVFEGSVQVSD